jgi:hypothetical protein
MDRMRGMFTMVTEPLHRCQVEQKAPGQRQRAAAAALQNLGQPDYRAATAFSCAIIDAMVSRMLSMLRPVSVAAST